MNDMIMRTLLAIPFIGIDWYWANNLLDAIPFKRSTPLTVLLWLIASGMCLSIFVLILLYIIGYFENEK